MLNVFVLDAHAIYRRGLVASLAEIPDVRWVAEAGSVEEARAHPGLGGADLLVVDHAAPGAHALMRDVATTGRMRVVVCTWRCAEHDVSAAIDAGAAGVIAKATLTPDALVGALSAVGGGARDGSVRRHTARVRSGAPGSAALTARERRVLGLIADGRGTREVALELSYSERTVKNVLHDAATKLHARSRSQAVACAVRSGLI